MTIDPPDNFHLRAAEGWLGLGNTVEAGNELDQVQPRLQAHPDVLNLRWEILAAQGDWEAALDAASALIQVAPENAAGWVHRSYSLHELKRTAEARDNLLRVVDKFPKAGTLRYNLACYECRLGRIDHARNWLRKAFASGEAADLREAAVRDADLEPLWPEVAGL